MRKRIETYTKVKIQWEKKIAKIVILINTTNKWFFLKKRTWSPAQNARHKKKIILFKTTLNTCSVVIKHQNNDSKSILLIGKNSTVNSTISLRLLTLCSSVESCRYRAPWASPRTRHGPSECEAPSVWYFSPRKSSCQNLPQNKYIKVKGYWEEFNLIVVCTKPTTLPLRHVSWLVRLTPTAPCSCCCLWRLRCCRELEGRGGFFAP